MVEDYSPAPISSRCGRASMFMMSRPFEKKTYRKICNLKIKCLPLQSQALTNGSIAQLVQSICLTSRGSGVRIPLLPLRKTTDGRLFSFIYIPDKKLIYRVLSTSCRQLCCCGLLGLIGQNISEQV